MQAYVECARRAAFGAIEIDIGRVMRSPVLASLEEADTGTTPVGAAADAETGEALPWRRAPESSYGVIATRVMTQLGDTLVRPETRQLLSMSDATSSPLFAPLTLAVTALLGGVAGVAYSMVYGDKGPADKVFARAPPPGQTRLEGLGEAGGLLAALSGSGWVDEPDFA